MDFANRLSFIYKVVPVVGWAYSMESTAPLFWGRGIRIILRPTLLKDRRAFLYRAPIHFLIDPVAALLQHIL